MSPTRFSFASPRRPISAIGLVVAAGLFSGCAERADRASDLPPIGVVDVQATPIFDRASTPNLVAAADGAVHLSFTEQLDSAAYALRFVTLRDGAWGEPLDINRNRALWVNWADFPSMTVLDNGDLAAHWLEREGPGTYSYGVRIARSVDAGATWDSARTPHADGLLAEHGFVSLWPAGGDALGAVWLDGRKTAMPDSAREMTIRTAVLGQENTPAPEVLLDARACDCCQTSTAATRQGRVIVYRDRSIDEIRDIAIVREVNGTWSAPAVVHADNWHFDACPVNGPSVSALGDTVVVAWFTGAQDTARVRIAISTNGGASFGDAVRIDDGDPIGRTTVVLDDDARPVVLWMERISADSADIRVRRVGAEGALSPAVAVARISANRRSGFPRMVKSGDRLVFAWTVPGGQTQVRVASAPITPGRSATR